MAGRSLPAETDTANKAVTMLTTNLITALAAVLFALCMLWLISLPLRNASIVDPFWGAGFVLVTWLTWWLATASPPRSWWLLGMITAWGTRLSLFLLLRNCGHGEDRRYVAMRRYHGARFWWVSLGTVFLLQGVILWIVAQPLLVSLTLAPTTAWSLIDGLGVFLWAGGLLFESIGDWQLARFKSDPDNKGRVMDRGLWRYTRHPNYFGDACVWWGVYLVAAAGGAGWTFFSPLLMTFLLMKVSGVTLLEHDIADRRPDYAAYQARTSAFIPWPPRA